MKKHFVFLCFFVVALSASAVHHVGFGADAFSRAFPVSYKGNVVFSPASFEIDCAIVAESLATIPKANVSEMMGVVLDFERSYGPELKALTAKTNGFSFITARGFCVPDIKKARADHRIFLSSVYEAEVMQGYPLRGALNWFRAAMDGEMEDFEIPIKTAETPRYSLYDLVSFKVAWRDPFPKAKMRKIAFQRAGGGTAQVDCLCDVRVADTWENDNFTLLKLPLCGDSWFYALLPKEGAGITPARTAMTSAMIDKLLVVTKSLTERGVRQGACSIVLPRLEIFSRLNIADIFAYFRIPTKGLVLLAENAVADEMVQCMRFRLVESENADEPSERRPRAEASVATDDVKSLVFDHPFLFFIHHEPTDTIPAAGQFAGE